MSNATWCAINTSDSNSLVSKSATQIQRLLTDYPQAEVRWFTSPGDGWRWIRGHPSSQTTPNTGKVGQHPSSPRTARIRAGAPYVIPGPSLSPQPKPKRLFEREMIMQTLRNSRPSLFDTQISESSSQKPEPESASDYGDSDYEFDEHDEELLSSYDQLAEDPFLDSRAEAPRSSSSNPKDETQADEDNSSTNSYDQDYPLADFPLESELECQDPPTPTPPTSQVDSSQPFLTSSPTPACPRKTNTTKNIAPGTVVNNMFSDLFALSSSPPETSEHSRPTSPVEIQLSNEQKDVLQRVLAGESLFFTGPAGTGKSVLLREIIRKVGAMTQDVAVTASTGVAALNIGGKTLHSFAGIGLGKQDTSILINKVENDSRARHRWRYTKILIVDEISMVDGDLFDTLELIARSLRRNKRPFGGIQLVLCGDFFQLPPVDQQHPDATLPGRGAKFAFASWSWRSCVPTTITLTQVFRQREPRLIQMLNEMRVGTASQETIELVHSLSRRLVYEDGIEPMELFPRRLSVDHSNQRNLDILPGDLVTFESRDSFYYDAAGQLITPSRGREMLDRLASRTVQVKVGAQVMCLKNLGGSAELVNGSIGKIINFMTPLAARSSRAAGSQSSISIASDLEPDLFVDSRFRRPPDLLYEKTEWPVVEYMGGNAVLMGPCAFTVERLTDGEVQAKRMQVPLTLAWALTIHKSQGQTLSRVKVDLRGTFECGQAYVALSRCTSLDGLEVKNFSPSVIMADPRVMEWTQDPDSYNSSSEPLPEYQRPVRQPAPPPFGKFKNNAQLWRTVLSQSSTQTQASDDEGGQAA